MEPFVFGATDVGSGLSHLKALAGVLNLVSHYITPALLRESGPTAQKSY